MRNGYNGDNFSITMKKNTASVYIFLAMDVLHACRGREGETRASLEDPHTIAGKLTVFLHRESLHNWLQKQLGEAASKESKLQRTMTPPRTLERIYPSRLFTTD